MAQDERSRTLADIAQMVDGDLAGDPSLAIHRPVPAGENDPHGITFAGNEKYLRLALESQVGAILVPPETPERPGRNLIRCVNPRHAFGIVLALYERRPRAESGIHPTAIVDPRAHLGENVSIGAYVVVAEDSVIEDEAVLMPFSYVGPGCVLGARSRMYPHAVLVQDVHTGPDCIFHSGCVIGSDGFGFAWNGQEQQKIPQAGGVQIGRNVEVGANTCIDRATAGSTIIDDGVKLDNLVQIGHNSKIGAHTVMASQVGISGSTTIGERNVFGGQAATSDHVSVGDGMVFGGRSGIIGNMDQPGEYFGLPAVPLTTAMRIMALQTRLPELFKRMRALEQELEKLTHGK